MKEYYNFKRWLLIPLWFLSIGVFAQQQTVTGRVAQSDGTGLPGVTVLVAGTTSGVVTDMSGDFRINVSSSDELIFSFVGFQTQTIEVGSQTVINVTMTEDVGQLDEIVVIGYGEQSKALLTSSVASVKSEAIKDLQVPSIEGVLQGRVPGVSVLSGSGQPGVAPTIRVRGGSSIQGYNDPLFIIDGVQRSAEDFNPDNVASIEILKDASATAIYGARGSNGVILVTTKQGEEGAAQFDVGLRTTWSSLANELDLLGAEDYIRIERIGLTRSFLDENSAFGAGSNATGIGNPVDGNFTLRALADGESVPAGYKSMVDPITGQTLIFQDVDWQDVAYRPTKINNVNASVSGGKDGLRYYSGIAYLNQEGIAEGTAYERVSFLTNTEYQINDKLKFSTNVNFTKSFSDAPYSTSIMFGRAARLAPTTRQYYEDGTIFPGSSAGLPNPEWYAQNFLNKEVRDKLGLGATLQYDIIDGLKAIGTISSFNDKSTQESFVNATDITSSRQATANYREGRTTQAEATLSYSKEFGIHNLNAMMGSTYLNSDYFMIGASGEGGPTNSIQTINASPETQGTSFHAQDRLIGFFGRVSYDFDRKYLLTATIRRDGSSRFGFENQIGYFPSFSGGWRISEENFFGSSLVSDLKLRASWGQTGNNDFGNPGDLNRFYLSQGVVDATYTYNGQAAARTTALPNPQLGWETTSQGDIGLDVGLFSNRVNLAVDAYRKVTSDLLFPRPLPNTSGFTTITQNIGEVEFKGLEIAISSDNLQNGSLSWTTDFNISFASNKVLSLPENGRDKNRIGGYELSDGTGIGGIAEGEPLRQIVGWQMLSVYATTAEAQEEGQFVSFANDRTSRNGVDYRERVGGDVRWQDLNGDNIIDNDDLQTLGYATPNVTGGFANTLKYGGFELYVFLDFALGHHIYNSHRARMNSNSQGNINGTADLLRAWNEEGDETDIPRFTFFDFGNARNHDIVGWGSETSDGGLAQRAHSMYTEKGDYLCIRNVRVTYNLPGDLKEKIGLNTAQVYLMGQNLHYFTKYQGYNPEVGAVDLGRYPLFKSLSLGLNIGF